MKAPAIRIFICLLVLYLTSCAIYQIRKDFLPTGKHGKSVQVFEDVEVDLALLGLLKTLTIPPLIIAKPNEKYAFIIRFQSPKPMEYANAQKVSIRNEASAFSLDLQDLCEESVNFKDEDKYVIIIGCGQKIKILDDIDNLKLIYKGVVFFKDLKYVNINLEKNLVKELNKSWSLP